MCVISISIIKKAHDVSEITKKLLLKSLFIVYKALNGRASLPRGSLKSEQTDRFSK